MCAAAAVLASTAAADAGVLPEPIQQMAHVTVGAPAPHHHDSSVRPRSGPRQDTRHQHGLAAQPAPGPGRSADADGSPGHAHIPPLRRGPLTRPGPPLRCEPGVHLGPTGTYPAWPPPGPSYCSEHPGKLPQ